MTAQTFPRFASGRNVRLFTAYGAIASSWPLFPVWVLYLVEYRGLSLAQVGALELPFWVVKLLAEIPTGAYADRFGRRASLIAGVLLSAVAITIFALAGSFPLLLISYVVWAFGFSFQTGSDSAYLYDALAAGGREREYARRAGIYLAAGRAGQIVAALAGGLIADRLSLVATIWASLIPLALAVPLLAAMREPPRPCEGRIPGYGEMLRGAARVLRRQAAVRALILFEVLLGGALIGQGLLMQPFLHEHGVPVSLFGVMVVPLGLAAAAANTASARFAARIGLPALCAAALATAVGSLAILAGVDHAAAALALAATAGAVGLAAPAIGQYVNDRVPADVRATVLSAGPLGTSLLSGLVNPFVGWLGDRSLAGAYGALALLVALGGVAAYLVWLRAEGATRPPQDDVLSANS